MDQFLLTDDDLADIANILESASADHADFKRVEAELFGEDEHFVNPETDGPDVSQSTASQISVVDLRNFPPPHLELPFASQQATAPVRIQTPPSQSSPEGVTPKQSMAAAMKSFGFEIIPSSGGSSSCCCVDVKGSLPQQHSIRHS